MNTPRATTAPLVVIAHGYAHHFWGSERVALDCARAYRTAGWRVQFYLPGPGIFTNLVASEGFEVIIQKTCSPTESRLVRLAKLPIQVDLRLRRSKPDLIHATSLGPLRALMPGARLQGIPAIVQLQTHYTPDDLSRGLVPWTELVLPVSHHTAHPVRELFARRKGKRAPDLEVLLPPIAVPNPGAGTKAESLRRKWNIQPGEIVVGMVGQVIDRKGVDLFLRACAGLLARSQPIRPVLVGNTPAGNENYGHEMNTLIRELGIGDSLIRTGFVHDVDAHFSSLDILAVPSRREGLGLVAGEAGICETAIIATNVGGLPEMVNHGETGLLIPPDNVSALGRVLGLLVQNTDLRNRLARSARQFATQNFCRLKFEKKIMTLVNSTQPSLKKELA